MMSAGMALACVATSVLAGITFGLVVDAVAAMLKRRRGR